MRITVITSTIGRPELRQCIESVRAQTIEADHFVFVNGPKYHESARKILDEFPGVHAIYLPEETGDYGMGGSMADVFAAAPFLTRSEWIAYLDDDNFYDPGHLESLLNFATTHGLKWAYSLRRFTDKEGKPICDDDWSSLGHWPPIMGGPNLVDNSCYFVSRALARRVALAWTAAPYYADRCYFMALKESGTKSGCTGLSSVNYRTGSGSCQDSPSMLLRSLELAKAAFPGGFPWRTPSVFS
jgi:glycosyltransferase involved in cell wall biosynthesis